jgi:hypothetical protein
VGLDEVRRSRRPAARGPVLTFAGLSKSVVREAPRAKSRQGSRLRFDFSARLCELGAAWRDARCWHESGPSEDRTGPPTVIDPID